MPSSDPSSPEARAAQDLLKQTVAAAALEHITPQLTRDAIVGIGTGTTANFFIDCLAAAKDTFRAAVASSEASRLRLERHGIEVVGLDVAQELAVYVDGADEVDRNNVVIKGGRGALTREKIVTSASREFVCIVDESKLVDRLGGYPLPIEVIALAEPLVARIARALGGTPVPRQGFVTDNGNRIIDVEGLTIDAPFELEAKLDGIPGIVCHGVFATHRPSIVLAASASGVITRPTPT